MPQDEQKPDQTESSTSQITFRQFLETVPPSASAPVKDVALARRASSSMGAIFHLLNLPVIELHCGTDSCAGVRLFQPIKTEYSLQVHPGRQDDVFVEYQCRNCCKTKKTYALSVFCEESDKTTLSGRVHKYGELPLFGSPTPARVITLLGSERDYYLKGRRAEYQGMGIAAFAYYRRVVENQKNRLLDEIVRVAEKVGASQDMLADLNEATSVATSKPAIRGHFKTGQRAAART